MHFEIVLNGNRITDHSRAEELFAAAGLRKTAKFEYFCDIITGVEKLVEETKGKVDRIVYDYDEKSGIINCSLSVLHVENGLSNTMYLFKYMINRVDIFEVESESEGLSMRFVIKDIFEEDVDVIQFG